MCVKEFGFNQLKYAVKYPQGFSDIQKYPVIFYFHGAGGIGNDMNTVLSNPIFEEMDKHDEYSFITVAPLCAKDPVVFVEESIKMVDKVNACGGNAKLTIYPENEHDAWTDTFSNPEVIAWLLQHEKNQCEEMKNEYF